GGSWGSRATTYVACTTLMTSRSTLSSCTPLNSPQLVLPGFSGAAKSNPFFPALAAQQILNGFLNGKRLGETGQDVRAPLDESGELVELTQVGWSSAVVHRPPLALAEPFG